MINELVWTQDNNTKSELQSLSFKSFNMYSFKFRLFFKGKTTAPKIMKIGTKNCIVGFRYIDKFQYVYLMPLQNPIPIAMIIAGLGFLGLSIWLLKEIKSTNFGILLPIAGLGGFVVYKKLK